MKFTVVHILSTALLCVFGATLVGCAERSSDEQQVRDVFASAEEAAEARDVSDVLELVADDYRDAQGLDKQALTNFVRAYFFTHPKLEIVVTIENVVLPVPGLAQVDVTLATLGPGENHLERLAVELRKNGDEWRVSRADRR